MDEDPVKIKSTNARIIFVLGLLAAVAANVNFSIPGVPNLTSDPREIVALVAVFFILDWPGAIFVGLMAGLGGPYNQTLWVTGLMHVLAIPLAWIAYRSLRKHSKNIWVISTTWILIVIATYVLVFTPVFTISHTIDGTFSIVEMPGVFLATLKGMRLELFLTALISMLILQIKIAREERDFDTQLLGMLVRSKEYGLMEWLIPTDKLVINQSLTHMLQRDMQEIGESLEDFLRLVHKEELPLVREKLNNLRQGHSGIANIECRLKNGNGDWIWTLINAMVVERDELNRPTRIVAAQLDISELKETTAENLRLREQLIQAQRLESIGTMAGGIAHDFNNLLTVINGHAEMAAMRLDKNNAAYKDVSAIHSAGARAADLTRQLLAFSRKQEMKPRILDLNSVIRELEKMQRRLIGEDIATVINLQDNLPKIKADSSQLEQILLNLVVNARDAINEKTDKASQKKITIDTFQKTYTTSYVSDNTFVPAGQYVVLAVSDNGIGMDAKQVTKIFEPFFTTKKEGKGTGLGLAIIYGIVKQNKGFLSVYSEPEIGTTFKIYWPICNDMEHKVVTNSEASPAKLHGNEQIILVEDDPAVLDFASAALNSFGYEVFTAADGEEAVELVKTQKVKPALIITDMIMPHLNGRELAKELNHLLPNCAILFTSGYTDTHIKSKEPKSSNFNFIQKPYSVHELLTTTREILDKSNSPA